MRLNCFHGQKKNNTTGALLEKNDLVFESRTDLAGFEVSGVLGY